MPLPQQVVERLARETPKTQGWSAELLAFSVVIFVISIVVYGGIFLGYRPYTTSQIEKLDSQINAFEQQTPAADQQKIAVFYSQLINLRTILGSRTSASPIFSWLESHTEQNVAFANFTLDLGRNQLTLAGTAKSADDVALAARVFEQDPNVTNVLIGSITGGTSEWQFTMTLTFAPGFLRSTTALLSTTP